MGFEQFELQSEFSRELSEGDQRILVRAWGQDDLTLEPDATHFGMVAEGRGFLKQDTGPFVHLIAGMYFVAPREGLLGAGPGSGLVVSVFGYQGLRQFGGPVEKAGRLRYIDGCTDTLLVCPPVLGEPCLNHLHIPAGTRQSQHTHPSVRLGIVLSGHGWCWTEGSRHELRAGTGWWIPTGCLHSFETEDSPLDVMAWHPDSDFGPTDGFHPMLNRTLLPS